jgi:hypothetical protein
MKLRFLFKCNLFFIIGYHIIFSIESSFAGSDVFCVIFLVIHLDPEAFIIIIFMDHYICPADCAFDALGICKEGFFQPVRDFFPHGF